ncbi:hypothetical protein FANTH_9019 [Fusarium anthophilum]|uniref:Uncharacterized protein n=1 Tax=Fusarium anthophilum TaxID=48485 RepID=A0A8H5DZP7_9HYPO|nr:hypothetical protein FANTH_9019 [Fusarium anthophilum]
MPSTPAQPTDAPAPVDSAKPEAGAPAWSGEFQACPSDVKSGMMHCFSETSWGICNGGWAFVSTVAEGTKCIDGAIAADRCKDQFRKVKDDVMGKTEAPSLHESSRRFHQSLPAEPAQSD